MASVISTYTLQSRQNGLIIASQEVLAIYICYMILQISLWDKLGKHYYSQFKFSAFLKSNGYLGAEVEVLEALPGGQVL